jgi:chloride channel protein, CIC family
VLRTAHEAADPERLLAQRLYPVLDGHDHLVGVVTRTQLLHADPSDPRPLAELAAIAVTAHPDETLRTLANRMARHGVTRLLIVGRGPQPASRASSASATSCRPAASTSTRNTMPSAY